MSVRGGLGICERWCEVGGWAVVTVVRNVGTTVSPIVVLPRVVLKKKKRINKVGEVEGDWVVEDNMDLHSFKVLGRHSTWWLL